MPNEYRETLINHLIETNQVIFAELANLPREINEYSYGASEEKLPEMNIQVLSKLEEWEKSEARVRELETEVKVLNDELAIRERVMNESQKEDSATINSLEYHLSLSRLRVDSLKGDLRAAQETAADRGEKIIMLTRNCDAKDKEIVEMTDIACEHRKVAKANLKTAQKLRRELQALQPKPAQQVAS
jgi:chromosome segregation ATPase